MKFVKESTLDKFDAGYVVFEKKINEISELIEDPISL